MANITVKDIEGLPHSGETGEFVDYGPVKGGMAVSIKFKLKFPDGSTVLYGREDLNIMEGHEGSTADALDRIYAGCIGLIQQYHKHKRDDTTGDYDGVKQKFVSRLQEAIKSNLPEYGGVTNKVLEEFAQIVENGDFRNIETVEAIKQKFYDLRGDDLELTEEFREKLNKQRRI